MKLNIAVCLTLLFTASMLTACGAQPSSDQIPEEVIRPKTEGYTKQIVFRNRTCEITVAKDYAFSVIDKGNFKAAMLTGPEYDNGKHPVVTVNMIQVPSGVGEATAVEDMMNATLNPFRKRLLDYKELSCAPVTVNGKKFENTTFSGNLIGLYHMRGSVYVAYDNGMAFTLFGQDMKSHWSQSEPTTMDIFKSFKILPAAKEVKEPVTKGKKQTKLP